MRASLPSLFLWMLNSSLGCYDESGGENSPETLRIFMAGDSAIHKSNGGLDFLTPRRTLENIIREGRRVLPR